MKKCHEVLPKVSRTFISKCHELLPEKSGKSVTKYFFKVSQYYGCIFIRKNKPTMRDKQYRKIPYEVLAFILAVRFKGFRYLSASWPGIEC